MNSLNISKAFASFSQNSFLSKLLLIDFHYTLNTSVSSFLHDMLIATRTDGFSSNPDSINASSPQGSVISPVLFIFFISNLPSAISSIIHSVAYEALLFSWHITTYLCIASTLNKPTIIISLSAYLGSYLPITYGASYLHNYFARKIVEQIKPCFDKAR